MSMRGLTVFIADLRNCRARELEEKRINKEMANIRSKFKDTSLNGYQKKKYVCKLLYMYILGWEVDFGHMEAISLLSSSKYSEKQIGYLAVTLLLSENHDQISMIINAISRDLGGPNEIYACLALHAIANTGGRVMAQSLAYEVEQLLVSNHHRTFIKKKAALCLLRLFRKHPDVFQAIDWAPKIISIMDDGDMGVALSTATLVLALAQQYPEAYLESVPKAINRLHKMVIEKEYTADYMYYKVPCPWLQVKLLRLLQYYPGIEDAALEKRLNGVLSAILKNSQDIPKNVQHNNAQNAVLFEAINLAIHLNPDSVLVTQCSELLGSFISSKETNIRYLGLETMAHLAATASPDCLDAIKKVQDIIVASLKDKDISVRRRALDLLYSVCDETNAREIVSELLNYLAIADFAIREEMVLKIAILAEKFAMEYSWYVDVILQLITIAGDHVSDEVWYRVVQIVTNNEDLQVYAVATILGALRPVSCHETAVKVGGYLLGEFGHKIANSPGCAPIDQFTALHSKFGVCSPPTRALLLTTYLKFVNLFPEIRDEVVNVFRQHRNVIDVEMQQRAAEYFSLTIPEAEDLLQIVCVEMPSFPERESALLSRLNKKIEDTEDKRTWVIGGRDANIEIARRETKKPGSEPSRNEPLPSDLERAQRRANPPQRESPQEVHREVKAAPMRAAEPAAKQPVEKDIFGLKGTAGYMPSTRPAHQSEVMVDLLGLGDELGSASSLVSRAPDTPQDEVLYNRLLLNANGLLHRDQTLEIGIKSEYHDNLGRIAIFFGNRSSLPINSFTTDVRTDPGLKLTLTQPVPATIPAGSQFHQVYNIECLSPAIVGAAGLIAPSMGISFVGGQNGTTPASIALKIPIAMTKFVSPVEGLASADFFSRWKQIGGPPREVTAMFKATGSAETDVAEYRRIVKGLQFAILDGVDPSKNNLILAGIFMCSSFGKVGCLARVEISTEHKVSITLNSGRADSLANKPCRCYA
ncbi:hypothetical protein HK101_007652 [Irineochytrium annulatum]|nr:hypothetical protein HK101_007652 [Irineochytrium annulatum]